jgi:pyruvate formate lyase activating enzyme
LRFGGLQKHSLLDFPGKVSCVVFVSGCNFHCPYCHNPDLIDPSLDRISRTEILRFLEERKNFLDGVVVSGGEPTLQKDLIPFCEEIKSMGYALKVDTNGSRPDVLNALIQSGLVDTVAMDLKTLPHLYSPIITRAMDPRTLLESVRLILASPLDHEFRTTCAKPLVDETILQHLARTISGARRYALQVFREPGVLSPDFFRNQKKQFSRNDLLVLKPGLESHVQECLVR